MIGYPVTLSDVYRRIDAEHPGRPTTVGTPRANANRTLAWRERAKRETLRLRSERTFSVGRYGEFWRDLKKIYASIQGDGKCAYCEKKLSRRGRGGVEGDVEHYRPKDGVVYWNSSYGFTTGSADNDCYYLLAFIPFNYVLACETCNQDMKRNFFPIAGVRCSPHSCKSADLRAENPYLINPLDPAEPDPETLIGFLGLNPVPRALTNTHDYWRAMVTIELFRLGRGQRLDLDLERADVIFNLFIALQLQAKDPGNRDALDALALLHKNYLAHRNCARSFERLYQIDPLSAKQLAEQARLVLYSQP